MLDVGLSISIYDRAVSNRIYHLVIKILQLCNLLNAPMSWCFKTYLWCVTDAVPGAFTFLGIHNETAGSVHGLHTPQFLMDDAQLALGAALHAGVAISFFDQTGNRHSEL